MKEIERIVEGLNASLIYDYCCGRGCLFSEGYLVSSTGQILQSLHGLTTGQVMDRYQHPVLAPLQSGGGRRPEIDFVVSAYDDSSSVVRARSAKNHPRGSQNADLLLTAIETKWAGSSHCTVENIVWDLLRLAILSASNLETNCFFVIAGTVKELDKLTLLINKFLPFCQGPSKLSLLPQNSPVSNELKNIFSDVRLQDVQFPAEFEIKASSSVKRVIGTEITTVRGWQIQAFVRPSYFVPSALAEYKLSK